MPRHCCVTGCSSNYTRKNEKSEFTSTFSVLSECKGNDEKLQNWLRQIPRPTDNFPLNINTVICIKHFAEEFIIRIDTATRPDGSVLSVPRKIPKLAKDTYPSIFHNCPSYLSSEPPTKRRKPEDRQAEMQTRDNQALQQFLTLDKVASFQELCLNFPKHIPQSSLWNFKVTDSCLLFYIVDLSDVPCIRVSIHVTDAMSVIICCGGYRVDGRNLDWVIGKSGKLESYSQLTSLLSHYQGWEREKVDFIGKVEMALILLHSLCEQQCSIISDKDPEGDGAGNADDQDGNVLTSTVKCIRVVRHVIQQLNLLQQCKTKYCGDYLHWAFQVFPLSPTVYGFLRESTLMLPHPVYLRKLSSCFTVQPGIVCNSHITYLTKKCQLLEPHERYVTMLLDEIYVEPKVTYKAGTVKGFAANCDMTQATTVQAFMICSILSHRKDIAALVPVKNLTAPYLQEITMHVIRMVEKAGFRIICLISDNNRVNGNMFRLLCGGLLQPCIDHPCDNSRKLFFLFDTVHIFKCIRNNWINQKDSDQTFLFPDMLDENLLHKAKFNILKQLHENEKNNLVKLAPSLSFKALNPSNTERQSVPLMLCIFNEKVVAALTLLSQQQNPKFDKASVDDMYRIVELRYNRV